MSFTVGLSRNNLVTEISTNSEVSFNNPIDSIETINTTEDNYLKAFSANSHHTSEVVSVICMNYKLLRTEKDI